ncbi:MAG TPA: hypothetical protein VNA04_14360 [Thermoanaerobaculia bacterium]|nr:hypothetical protein [Thermoanaerobaculia bacterium]
MRVSATITLCALLFSISASAEERWILIAGTVNEFHTDARVFNPSFEKDIVVTARFLPTDTGNSGVITAPGTTFTVAKRSMHILNDVTSALFGTPALGAIQFDSPDPFEVTSRIYAQLPDGTLGQFGPGLPASAAKSKGAILQLKDNGNPGEVGTFRTNIGVLNPGNAESVVSWTLYDRNNAAVAAGTTTLPPYGTTRAERMSGVRWFQPVPPAGTDLSDAWVSFSATSPVLAYASVIDNGTTDQTFVPAVEDAGVAPSSPPSQPTTHTFDVTLQDFSITFSPGPGGIELGDTVRLRIRRLNGIHEFQMVGPDFATVVPNTNPGTATVERAFTVTQEGTYTYFCTVITCGVGHNVMTGFFVVGGEDPGAPGY